jgi:hypothetical protein
VKLSLARSAMWVQELGTLDIRVQQGVQAAGLRRRTSRRRFGLDAYLRRSSD